MEDKGIKALKAALEAAKSSTRQFAFAPNIVLNKTAGGKNKGQPEPVMVLDKVFIFKKDAGFADRLESLLGETAKVNPSILLCGKLRFVKGRFVLEVDRLQSKGAFEPAKAQLQLKNLARLPGLGLLKTAVVSDGPIADAAVQEVEQGEEGEQEGEGADANGSAGASPADPQAYAKLAETVTTLTEGFSHPRSAQAERLVARLAEAKGLGESGSFSAAIDLLEEVQAAVTSALRAEKDARDAGGRPGAAAFGRSRLVWSKARDVANQEMRKLQVGILKDPDTQRLPNFKTVMSNVEKMGAILSDYAALDAALDRYQAAKDEKEQTDTYAETRQLLADYRSNIAKNPLLQQIDANPYVSVKVLETLTTSLEAIGKLLKA